MKFSLRRILFSIALVGSSATLSNAATFDCDDAVPHSELYESGNYGAAFKEVEPIANERCAEHLLGVMYAKGQGILSDLSHAYALLLLAYSDGMSPSGKAALVPNIGDDDSELEIIQFGARLTSDQIRQAENLAIKLAGKRGKLSTAETSDRSKVLASANELRPRIAGYKLNGKIAALELPSVATPTSLGMGSVTPGYILTQVGTNPNTRIIPFELNFIEMTLSELARGVPGSDEKFSRLIDTAAGQGVKFAWLKAGTSVKILKFALNGGFAAQVQLDDERSSIASNEYYWIDTCYLKMKNTQDQVLWKIFRSDGCRR
jgi:hypothetical protein